MYKYQSMRSCANVFADLLFEMFGEFARGRVVVPLPTIEEHKRARGFDHTALLAKKTARRCGGRCEKVLRRLNSTVQVGADAERRKRQAEEAYGVVSRKMCASAKYLLLDDVWTTGSSMMAACRELQKVGADDISVLLMAKSG